MRLFKYVSLLHFLSISFAFEQISTPSTSPIENVYFKENYCNANENIKRLRTEGEECLIDISPSLEKESHCKRKLNPKIERNLVTADNSEWVKNDAMKELQGGPCTLERIDMADLLLSDFLEWFAFSKPFVLIGAFRNKEFVNLTQKKNLLSRFGDTIIQLSSANSYSYEKVQLTFREYCENYLHPQSISTLANETFYFFGDNANENWFSFLEEYVHPPYHIDGYSSQLSFGIAGPGSGVPFHFHGPGFSETIRGSKRWFMYPPEISPSFHPNRTTLQWFAEEYPKLVKDDGLLECTVEQGEMIYFPNQWWHATLNIDTSIFMSTFFSP